MSQNVAQLLHTLVLNTTKWQLGYSMTFPLTIQMSG